MAKGITQEMKKENEKARKRATDYLDELAEKENNDTETLNARPPELWNYPKIIHEDHRFRTVAKPE